MAFRERNRSRRPSHESWDSLIRHQWRYFFPPRNLTRRLKTLCPALGKKRIAQILAREGLHLSVTTAGRMLKRECTRVIQMPLRNRDMERQLEQYARWFNQHRPHQGLDGRTPLEKVGPSPIKHLRIEPRAKWPIPHLADGAPSAIRALSLDLVVTHLDGEKHLPIVELKLAA